MSNKILIDGTAYDANTLTMPASGREFRDAWAAPVDNVIQLDPDGVRAIMAAKVQAERERRLALGFAYDFADERGVHQIATSDADMSGWNEVTTAANAMIALGNAAATIDIFTDTGAVTVTATEWMQILLAASAHRQPIWTGSFWLQMQDPIPADYATNDTYWQGA